MKVILRKRDLFLKTITVVNIIQDLSASRTNQIAEEEEA